MEDKFKFDESTRLGRVLSRIFGGDERNLVNFSLGLGIPAAIMASIGLFMTCTNIWMGIFAIVLVAFCVWALYNALKMYSNILKDHD